jgi:hypothetical protein
MLTAVDRSETMIHSFWPGDIKGSRRLIRSDWFAMPFHRSTFHLIVGDGVFNFMSFPEGYRHFAQMLSDLLLPFGRICVRVFTQLPEKEKTEEVIESLHRNETIDYFIFRYRLATSLQPSAEEGIYVTADSLDQYLTENGNLLPELYAKSGYVRPKTILTDPTKSDYRISYPTELQFKEQAKSVFDSIEKYNGSHTLAYRTPMFVLKKG